MAEVKSPLLDSTLRDIKCIQFLFRNGGPCKLPRYCKLDDYLIIQIGGIRPNSMRLIPKRHMGYNSCKPRLRKRGNCNRHRAIGGFNSHAGYWPSKKTVGSID
jgi:hypothetical protein